MAVADHGGFDVAVEVSLEEISRTVRGLLGSVALAPTTFSTPTVSGEIVPKVRVTGVSLATDHDVTVRLDISGTLLRITSIAIPGGRATPVSWGAEIPIGGMVEVTDHLEVRGTAVVVDFTRGSPAIRVTVDRRPVLESPLGQLYAAYRRATNPPFDLEQEILDFEEEKAASAIGRVLTGLGCVTVVPPLPPPVTSLQLRVGPESVHLLYMLNGGEAGDPCAITRSMLAVAADGNPDAAAIALSNASLLRDFVRPALAQALRLDTTGFDAGHPCAFEGRAPLPITLPPGIESAVTTSVRAGVDDEAKVRVVIRVNATGVGGSFSYRLAIDSSFAMTASVTAGSPPALTVDVQPLLPPLVASDIAFAWWVYAATAVFAGAPAAVALAAVDAFGGLVASGVVANLVRVPRFAVSLPLPDRQPSLSVHRASLTQHDAPTPAGGTGLSGQFRAHDLIIKLV